MRWRSATCALSVWAAFCAGAPAARATVDPTQQRALLRYREGLRHYDRAEFDEAIAAFKDAYAMTHDAALLFDIGQAYRRKGSGSCGLALQFFRDYQAANPNAALSAPRAKLIAETQACADRERAAQREGTPEQATPGPTSDGADRAAESPTPPSAPAAAPHRSRSPLLLGITGLTLSAAGGALWWWAHDDYESVAGSGCAPACNPASTDGIKTRQLAGVALVGTGAAAAVAALLWWRLSLRAGASSVALVPARAGLMLAGTF